jgi:hypothetical protein
MTPAQEKVKQLFDEMNKLRREYNEACKAAFPVGTEVSYVHGDRLRFGRVVDTGYGHRVKVESASGAAPWIDTYRIIEELE